MIQMASVAYNGWRHRQARYGYASRQREEGRIGRIEQTQCYEFTYEGGGMGKGGKGTLFVSGKTVATGKIDQTQCCFFSPDDGADVGADEGTRVTEAYKVPATFTGKIAKVTIELQEVKAAAADEAKKAHKQAASKQALSD